MKLEKILYCYNIRDKVKNNKLEEIKKIIIRLHDLNNIANNNCSKKDVDESIKLGKKYNKILKNLLNSSNGKDELTKCLEDDNQVIRFTVARSLFPLYPNRTLKIMSEYLTQTQDPLEKMRVKDVIEGFQSKQKIFMDQFKKLYNVDDLDSLNMEK